MDPRSVTTGDSGAVVTLAQFQALPGSPSMATLRRRLAGGTLDAAMVRPSRPGRGHPALFDLQKLRTVLNLAAPSGAAAPQPAPAGSFAGEALSRQLLEIAREVAGLRREVAEATARFDGAVRQLALRYDAENTQLRTAAAASRQGAGSAPDPLLSARLAQIQSSLQTLIDVSRHG